MIASDLVRAVVMFALAGVAAASGHSAIAIALAAASSLGTTVYAPALAAITPAVVTEEDLAPANAAMTAVENVALAAGPAVGGILLLLGSPAVAFAINGATFLASAVILLPVRPVAGTREERAEGRVFAQLREGIRTVFTSADLTILIVTVVVATLIYGHESVLLVLVSEERLGTGAEGVGFLFAAIGVGGILGAVLSGRLSRSPHPGRFLAIGMLAPGLGLAALAFVTVPAIAYTIGVLDGAGSVVVDVLALTMLQRLVRREVMARIFGVLMSLGVAGTILGSLNASLVLGWLGLRGTLLVAGAIPVLALAVTAPKLRALSERAARRGMEAAPEVDLLAGLRLFMGAPRQSLEVLARTASEQRVRAGEIVIHQGDPPDDLFVVRSGTLETVARAASGSEGKLSEMESGDYFGEIGLLRRVPRTATVRALTDCDLLRIPGDDFLAVVNSVPTVSMTLLDSMASRLARSAPAPED